MARTSRRAVRRGGVDPREEPSAEWGWHGTFPNAMHVSGLVVAVALLVSVFGPYESRLQDWWLVGIALGIIVLVVRDIVKRRAARRP